MSTTAPAHRSRQDSSALTVSVDDSYKLDGVVQDYTANRPTGGTAEYREKIDQLVKDLVESCASPNCNIFKAFSTLRGALVPLAVKPGANLSEAEKR